MKDDKIDEAIYNEILKNLDVPEIYDLCRQISEKFLTEDDEMYQYFHDRKNIEETDS